jgi:hypothetical protein
MRTWNLGVDLVPRDKTIVNPKGSVPKQWIEKVRHFPQGNLSSEHERLLMSLPKFSFPKLQNFKPELPSLWALRIIWCECNSCRCRLPCQLDSSQCFLCWPWTSKCIIQ